MEQNILRQGRTSKFDSKTCRICLTEIIRNNNDLTDPLVEKTKNPDSPLIFEALEEVIGEKIMKLDGCYSGICSLCLGLLTIAFDFKIQYYKNKIKIMESIDPLAVKTFYNSYKVFIKNVDDLVEKKSSFKEENKPSVELVSGKGSYDIKDLVIVEEHPKENSEIFRGFVNNLGTEISASFAEKVSSKNINKVPKPDVKIIKTNSKASIDIVDFEDNHDVPDFVNSDGLEMTENLCPHCEKAFSSETYLQTHIAVCAEFKLLRCYICKEKKQTQKRLILHLIKKHSVGKDLAEVAYPKDKEPVVCKVCKRVCVTKEALRFHMYRHREHKYSCEHCGKTFPVRFYMKNHILNVHTKTTEAVCPICGKTFHYLGGLKTHMRIHRKDYKKETVEVCPFCAKTFHYAGALTYHIKTHTKEYNVKCSYCDRKFGSKSAQKRHERLHTGEKPFACRYCDKAFTASTLRITHEMAIHTGERPNKCEICGSTFVRKEKLKRHMLTHEGPEKCFVCKRGLINVEMLKLHLRTKHKILPEEGEHFVAPGKETRKDGIDRLSESDEDPVLNYKNLDDDDEYFLE